MHSVCLQAVNLTYPGPGVPNLPALGACSAEALLPGCLLASVEPSCQKPLQHLLLAQPDLLPAGWLSGLPAPLRNLPSTTIAGTCQLMPGHASSQAIQLVPALTAFQLELTVGAVYPTIAG